MFSRKSILSYMAVILCLAFASISASAQNVGSQYLDKGIEYMKSKDYANAAMALEKACKLNVYEPNSSNWALINSYVATCYGNIREYDKAISYALLSKGYYEVNSPLSRDHAVINLNLSYYYYGINDYESALSYVTVSFDILEKLETKFEDVLVIVCQQGGKVALALEDYESALQFGDVELSIAPRGSMENDSNYATTLNNQAYCAARLGMNEKAIEYSKQCLEIRQFLYGEDDMITALTKNNLVTYLEAGYFPLEAIKMAQSAISSFLKIGTNECFHKAIRLYKIMATCYCQISDYTSSIGCCDSAITISKQVSPKPNEGYAMILLKKSETYHLKGDIPNAVYYGKEAKSALQNSAFYSDENYLSIVTSLANNYILLGEPSTGIEELTLINKEQLSQIKSAESKAFYYNTLSKCYDRNNDLSMAKKYGLLALDFSRDGRFTNEGLQSIILFNLGSYYQGLKEYESAAECYCQALVYFKKNNNDRYYVAISNALGSLWSELGKHEQSILSFFDAYNACQKIYGDFHEESLVSISNLANEYLIAGDIQKAKDYYTRYLQNFKHALETNVLKMTDTERESYWKYARKGIEWSMSHGEALEFGDEYLPLLFDIQLLSKGLLLSSEKAFERRIKGTNNLDLVARYEKIKKNRSTIALLKEDSDNITSIIRVNELEEENYFLQRDLMNKLPESDSIHFNFAELAALLSPGELVIDFSLQDLSLNQDCYALMYKQGWDNPKIIGICSGEDMAEIEKVINSKSPTEIYSGDISHLLYSLVWGEISKFARNTDKIYFSPSGVFNIINIESLSDKDGKLASENMNLIRLSSLKELRNKDKEVNVHSASLIGGLKYNSDEIVKNRKERNSENVTWGYLPSTKIEVEEIEKCLSQNNVSCNLLEGRKGTKAHFSQVLCNDFGVIHIATHGFHHRGESLTNPLSLANSGLIMAFDKNDNNILTAAEISNYDLSKTELATLSACYSGLGSIDSDGVWGLQRGLKIAGVKSILMSLWGVDDVASTLFMTTFYDNVCRSHNIRNSFHKAQEVVRENYPDPYYWAPFILID